MRPPSYRYESSDQRMVNESMNSVNNRGDGQERYSPSKMFDSNEQQYSGGGSDKSQEQLLDQLKVCFQQTHMKLWSNKSTLLEHSSKFAFKCCISYIVHCFMILCFKSTTITNQCHYFSIQSDIESYANIQYCSFKLSNAFTLLKPRQGY